MNLLTTLSDAASQIASWVNLPTYSYVRALWMPDPYIEGFAPLRFAVPLGPNYLPIWIDHFFIEKQLYMSQTFIVQWFLIRSVLIHVILFYQMIFGWRLQLGYFLQFNPYGFPLSVLWDMTDPLYNGFVGVFPIAYGMDPNPLITLCIMGVTLDYLKFLAYSLPYTAKDLKFEETYGQALSKIADLEESRNTVGGRGDLDKPRSYYFSTYYEGIPSYYLDNHKPVPNKLLESYWFGSGENSPAIAEYLLKAYPAEIEVRPDMLRLREIEELLLEKDPLLKGRKLPPIKDEFPSYPVTDELENLMRQAIIRNRPIFEERFASKYRTEQGLVKFLRRQLKKYYPNSVLNMQTSEQQIGEQKQLAMQTHTKPEIINHLEKISGKTISHTLIPEDTQIQHELVSKVKNPDAIAKGLGLTELIASSSSESSLFDVYNVLNSQTSDLLEKFFFSKH